MNEADEFASNLLEESKRFLEIAESAEGAEAISANLHAALNLGFCSLEAHVNSIAADFIHRTDLTPHEMGLLKEQKVDLKDGEYMLMANFQMFRLEDRLQFLWNRFSSDAAFDKTGEAWVKLKEGLKLRNGLTHPKEKVTLGITQVQAAVLAIIEILDIAYRRIYGQGFPAHSSGLNSNLTF
jgi:hypothetical protein